MPQLSMHSPVGDLTVFEDEGAIVAVEWGWVEDQTPTVLLTAAIEQLDAYMDGGLKTFDLPLMPRGSRYQQAVWNALRAIPFGQTCTYQALARQGGGSARSIGQANGRNPIPIIIPCHRVVAASHLGGYSGGDGLSTKQWLLALEDPQRPLFLTRAMNGEVT